MLVFKREAFATMCFLGAADGRSLLDGNIQGKAVSAARGSFSNTKELFATQNAVFEGNGRWGTENLTGAAVAVYSLPSQPLVTVSRCNFSWNVARSGGAVYFDSLGGAVAGCVFRNNTAERHGGGLLARATGLNAALT